MKDSSSSGGRVRGGVKVGLSTVDGSLPVAIQTTVPDVPYSKRGISSATAKARRDAIAGSGLKSEEFEAALNDADLVSSRTTIATLEVLANKILSEGVLTGQHIKILGEAANRLESAISGQSGPNAPDVDALIDELLKTIRSAVETGARSVALMDVFDSLRKQRLSEIRRIEVSERYVPIENVKTYARLLSDAVRMEVSDQEVVARIGSRIKNAMAEQKLFI